MNQSVREVAGNLCVDPSTVSRITTLFRTTGDVAKKPYPSERASRKLTEPAQFFVTRDLLQGSTDGQVHSLSLPNKAPPEIIAVGAALRCLNEHP